MLLLPSPPLLKTLHNGNSSLLCLPHILVFLGYPVLLDFQLLFLLVGFSVSGFSVFSPYLKAGILQILDLH